MASSAVKIENLSYAYKSNWSWKRKLAVKPYSLEIESGESFGFLGHNGAGKTTTIKCILDLIRPTTGTISIFGKESSLPEAREKVGYIPEQPYFYDNLTVKETLHLYGRLSGLKGKPLSKKAAEVMERVGLDERARSPLRSLSKGLTQRVALAQALLCEPSLLILDEPFSGLDPMGRKEFRDIFFALKEKGATLFISSHILSDVEYLCDRVSIMVKGEMRGVFKVRDIPRFSGGRYELVLRDFEQVKERLAKVSTKATFHENLLHLEFSERDAAEKALLDALGAHATVESFQFQQGSLEDLFMQVVSGNKLPGGAR